jgi:hypothetical protein
MSATAAWWRVGREEDDCPATISGAAKAGFDARMRPPPPATSRAWCGWWTWLTLLFLLLLWWCRRCMSLLRWGKAWRWAEAAPPPAEAEMGDDEEGMAAEEGEAPMTLSAAVSFASMPWRT